MVYTIQYDVGHSFLPSLGSCNFHFFFHSFILVSFVFLYLHNSFFFSLCLNLLLVAYRDWKCNFKSPKMSDFTTVSNLHLINNVKYTFGVFDRQNFLRSFMIELIMKVEYRRSVYRPGRSPVVSLYIYDKCRPFINSFSFIFNLTYDMFIYCKVYIRFKKD